VEPEVDVAVGILSSTSQDAVEAQRWIFVDVDVWVDSLFCHSQILLRWMDLK